MNSTAFAVTYLLLGDERCRVVAHVHPRVLPAGRGVRVGARHAQPLRGIVLEGHPRLLVVHLRFGVEGAPGDVLLHEEFVVRPEGALGLSAWCRPLSVEVLVACDRLATEVAHFGAALAPHLVASLGLEEGLLAPVALPDQGLGHLVLDVGPLAHLPIFFDLVAVQRDVAELLA